MFSEKEPILVIDVKCGETYSVSGSEKDIVMIHFSGTSQSPFFSGIILGTGVDTQKISKGEAAFLSARYMLEGEDFTKQKCRIFIENQGIDMNNCKPTIVTDSKALAELESISLRSVVVPADGGVIVKIYKE